MWLFAVLVLKLNFKKKITTCKLPYFAGIIVIVQLKSDNYNVFILKTSQKTRRIHDLMIIQFPRKYIIALTTVGGLLCRNIIKSVALITQKLAAIIEYRQIRWYYTHAKYAFDVFIEICFYKVINYVKIFNASFIQWRILYQIKSSAISPRHICDYRLFQSNMQIYKLRVPNNRKH